MQVSDRLDWVATQYADDGGWRIVHRHADSQLTKQAGVDQIAEEYGAQT